MRNKFQPNFNDSPKELFLKTINTIAYLIIKDNERIIAIKTVKINILTNSTIKVAGCPAVKKQVITNGCKNSYQDCF